MEIKIVRGGGIGNLKAHLGPVDPVSLKNGGEVTRKVEEIFFFDLPDELPRRNQIRDGFTYAMTIDDGGRSHTVAYADDSEVEAARPLFEVQRLLIANGCEFMWDLEEKRAMAGEDDDFAWGAWYNRMLGSSDPDLHVVGTRTFPSSGFELVLEPGSPDFNPHPEKIVLYLSIVEAPVGNEVIGEKQAIWSDDVGPGIESVEIRGDAQAEIPVEILE